MTWFYTKHRKDSSFIGCNRHIKWTKKLLNKNMAVKQIEASTFILTLLSAFIDYGLYHMRRLAFPGFTAWCRHFSTTASNTISLRQKLCTFTFSSLHAQNCQIRTKDSLWAHCVTVSELRCPAGQTACKFIVISIMALKNGFSSTPKKFS